jgi:hypothetical protein
MYYKIINNHIDVSMNQFFVFSHNTQTRGHNFKLTKALSLNNKVANQFKLRAIDAWNSLPYNVVNAHSVPCFKRLLRDHDLSQFLHR